MASQKEGEFQTRILALEKAVFGDPSENGNSKAVIPTLRRWAVYAQAAHIVAKALIVSIPTAAAVVAIGSTLRWW